MDDLLETLIATAQQGEVEAQFELASYYSQRQEECSAFLWSQVANGNGHEKAGELAEAIMASGLLLEEDLALAYLELGCWYHLGKNVPWDKEKSAKYLELAKQIDIPKSFDLEELRDKLDLPYVLDWDEIFPDR
jgi:TPR repeat protein